MMRVILLENIRKVGKLGETIDVKAGFGRNYLIPQNLAVFATEANTKHFEDRRAEFEKKAQQSLSNAEQRAAKLNDVTVTITAMASDEGKLYGSVGAAEIQEALAAKSIEVSKREIILTEGPFHSIGNYEVEVHVHSDVIAKLQIEVIPA